jgi:hypothetical protein
MTVKKKPRTGDDGASSNSMVMMEVGGTCHHRNIYDLAVNLERQPIQTAPACQPLALAIAAFRTRAENAAKAVSVNAWLTPL